jgi:hypothetical protein
LPLLEAQLELHHVGGKNQCVFGNLPKICVMATNGSQPGVLELACTPSVTELRTSAWKELFCESRDRSRIKRRPRKICSGEGTEIDVGRTEPFGLPSDALATSIKP